MSMMTKRKLILHFDIQNTILLLDTLKGINLAEAINAYLTGLVWGFVSETGHFRQLGSELSLKPPREDAVSYYKYLEKKIVGNGEERSVFQRTLQQFTWTSDGEKYRGVVEDILRRLEWKDEPDDNLCIEYQRKCYHYILPSFYCLLNFLQSYDDRDFAIVFRTFGADLDPVMKSIACILDKKESLCSVPLKVDQHRYHLKRLDYNEAQDERRFKLINQETCDNIPGETQSISNEGGKSTVCGSNITTKNYTEDCLVKDSENRVNSKQSDTKICSETYSDRRDCGEYKTGLAPGPYSGREMYSLFSSITGISGIRDDYSYWRRHQYRPDAGKPLWINLSDPTCQHILFDDNIRLAEPESIAALAVHDGKGQRVHDDVIINRCSEACLVQVNTLNAATEQDYFMKKIKNSIERYDSVLKDWNATLH